MIAIQIMEHVTHMLITAVRTHADVNHQNQHSLKNKHCVLKLVMRAPQTVIYSIHFAQCLYCKYTTLDYRLLDIITSVNDVSLYLA